MSRVAARFSLDTRTPPRSQPACCQRTQLPPTGGRPPIPSEQCVWCPMKIAAKVKRALRHAGSALTGASALLVQGVVHDAVHAGPRTALHYALNGNFDSAGSYLPGSIGFNLADVSSVARLRSLPDGV